MIRQILGGADESQAATSIASDAVLGSLLADCRTADDLLQLRRRVRSAEVLVRETGRGKGEVVRLACFRLKLERRLGAAFAATVRRGGVGSRSASASHRGGCSAGLPPGVTKQQAHSWRRLACLADHDFERCLALATASGRVPTFAALMPRGGAARRQPPVVRTQRSAELLARLAATFGPFATVVGTAAGGTAQLLPGHPAIDRIRGSVLVAETPSPEPWLEALGRATAEMRVPEAVVLVPYEPRQPWFDRLIGSPWLLTLVAAEHGGGVVCYWGARARMFALVMTSFGTTLRPLRI